MANAGQQWWDEFLKTHKRPGDTSPSGVQSTGTTKNAGQQWWDDFLATHTRPEVKAETSPMKQPAHRVAPSVQEAKYYLEKPNAIATATGEQRSVGGALVSQYREGVLGQTNYQKEHDYYDSEAKRLEREWQALTDKMSGGMPSAEDQKRLDELKSQYELAVQNRDAAHTRMITSENLAVIESWPEEDLALMQQYYENAMDSDPSLNRSFYAALKADKAENQIREKYSLSWDEFRKLAESYRWHQNEIATKKMQEETAKAVQGKTGAAIAHSALTLPAAVAGTVTAPLDYLGQALGRTGQYRTLDPNARGNLPNVYSSTVRQTVSKDIEGDGSSVGRKVASYLYQGGMSALDTGARLLASGGNPTIAATLAGLGTFGQTVSQASQQGASPAEAMLYGTAAAGIEALTEELPLDELVKTAKGGWKGLKPAIINALKQAGVEATEEELSLIGTTLVEAAILQDKSSYKQRIQQLVNEQGMSVEEATAQADYELLGEAMDTAVVSAISGGLSSAGGSTVAYMGRDTSGAQTAQAGKSTAQLPDNMQGGDTDHQPVRDDGQSFEERYGLKLRAVDEGTENTTSVIGNADSVIENEQNVSTNHGFVSGDVMTAQMAGIDTMQAKRLAEATGREIVFFTAPKTEDGVDNGYYRDGKIYINVNSENPLAQIVSHELTHSVEIADSYQQLQNVIIRRIQETGGNLNQLRQQKQSLYAKMGQNLSAAETDSEIVAEYVEKNLLTDEKAIMDVVRYERSLAQKIKGWLDRLLGKLGNTDAQERAFIEKARNLYAQALRQTEGASGQQNNSTQQGADHTAEFNESGWSTNEDAIRWARLELAAGRMTQGEFDEISDAYARFMEQENAKEPVEIERHSFGGVNAKTADMDGLERAKQMEAQDVANETIRQETGWFRGMDGKWRWEIDDSTAQVAGELSNYMTLGELLSGAKIFEAYPDLRDVSIVFQSLDKGVSAQYNRQFDHIDVSYKLKNDPDAIRSAVLHEIQHAIQNREGFSSGATVRNWERRIKNGFDPRKSSDIREAQEAEQRIQQFREEDPKLYRDMMELDAMAPNLPRGAIDWDTLEQIEEDPPEWKAYDARRDELENIYGEKMWDFNSALYDFQRINKRPVRTAEELYWDTAGEIEARNVAGRRNLDAEGRKNTPPNLGDENTVFAESSGISLEQSIDEYPYNMQTVIREYMDAVDQNVLSFIEEVQTGEAWKSKKVNVGNVSARMAEAIDRLTGVKGTEGNPIVLNTVTVEHIMKRHGSMGEADQSMRNNLDLARVNFVLQNFDNAELSDKKSFGYRNRDNSPSQNILFSKKINGTYFVIEAVPNTGKTGIVSAYINKKGVLQVLDDDAPSSDVRNVPAYTPKETLSQENSVVKEKHSFSAAGDQMANEEYAQTEGKTSDTSTAVTRDTLPRKAREYLARTEWKLLDKIGQSLSVPRFAQQNTLKGIVQEISDEYLSTGRVSDDTINSLFDRAYKEGVVADREFYEQYKEVKDHMRTTSVTLSDQDKSNIADFSLFRKSTMGTLRIVNNGGLPVDVAYMELQGMAPELFPGDITHPADQLMRMFEVSKSIAVSERTLNEYYGESASDFRAYAKNDFDAAIGDIVSELRNVKRYANDRAATQETADEAPKTPEEAKQYYAQLKDARRKYDRVMAKNLLTDHDSAIVGKLLTGQTNLENLDPNKENVKGIAAAYEAKQEYERIAKLLAEYRKNIKAGHRDTADGYLESANNWKDKGSGLAYSRETMERNVEDIVPDRELAKRINREYFETVRDAEAMATRFKNDWRDRVRRLNLSRMKKRGNVLSEASAVQLLGEAYDNIRVLEKSRGRLKQRDGKTLQEWRDVVDKVWAENPNLDADKIENAIKEFRKMYDELFELMNDVRIANGYEPANYRSGYFPHFQPGDGDSVLAHFGKALGIDTSVTALPTTINGLTHTFKPGIQWFGNAQERIGFNTTYDAVEGFDKYIEGIAGVIYQTENIQKLRALGTQIRYRTSDEGIRKQVDAVYSNPNLTEEEKQAQIEYIYKNAKYALSNFVNELDEYTNLLANKKSRLDRTVESLVGRMPFYNAMKWLERRVGANMIGGNLSSAFTNFIPLTQAWGQLSTKNLLHGMWDARRNVIKSDGFVDASSFLTNRRGSDPIAKAWTERVGDTMGIVMEMIDDYVSYSVAKGAYYQNLQRGLSETEAVHQADIFAARVMAERSKGGMPTLFESRNPFIKLFTQFQLEVNNQFSEVFKDMPRAYKNKALVALGFGFLKYFLGAWLYNELFEELAGRRPALDPIDIASDFVKDLMDDGIGEALPNLATNAFSQLPFSSGLTLFGIETDGGRFPVSSAIPNIPKLWDAATNNEWSAEKRWQTAKTELAKPLTYLASPFGGGGQIAKTVKGIKAVAEGGSYIVDSKTGEKVLQYPVFKDDGDNAWDYIRAGVFGKSAMDEAQDWVDSGFKNLSAEETKVYQDLVSSGAKDYEAYKLIKDIKTAKTLKGADRKKAERQALESVQFTEEEEKLAVGLILGTDMEPESGNPTEYAKFLSATNAGLSVDRYMEIRSAGVDTDKFLKLVDQGMDADEAADFALSMKDLEPEAGEDRVSAVQEWRLAVDRSSTVAGQLSILKGVMKDSQFAKAQTATVFDISLDAYVGYYEIRAKYDTDGNGSYTQKEVKAAIDSMGKYRLTNAEKAALWQLVTGVESAKNNPYSTTEGQRVIDYLNAE